MSLYKGTQLIAGGGNDFNQFKSLIEQLISQKIREDNEQKYCVGKLIIETENINPSTYLGFGTWEYFGEGRTLVGVDISQTEFNQVLKTGGSKYLQKHKHATNWSLSDGNAEGRVRLGSGPGGTSTGAYGFSVNENTNVPTGDSGNLQPYITVYMWRRIS